MLTKQTRHAGNMAAGHETSAGNGSISWRHSNTPHAPRQQKIYVGRHVVGEVRGGVFYKTVRASAHFLQKPRAIAFDVSTLHDAERAGALHVEITDSESGRVYRAPIAHVWARGFRVSRGFGEQVALTLGEWNHDAETHAEQLGLFVAG
jgi:hypothetical protein